MWSTIRRFLLWFALTVGVQVAAWVLMFACDPLRPIYFYFYYPVYLLFSGPHQSGLGFFLVFLPVVGTLIYSILFASFAALVSSHYHRRPSNVHIKERT
jgi:hypothetical protein